MSEPILKATLKAGADYSAPWLTVDATNVEDLSAQLDAILSSDVTERLIATANLLKAANNAAPLVANGQEAAAPQAAPPAQKSWGQAPAAAPTNGGPVDGAVHPTDVCQSCGQSPRYKNITAKSGKQFQLWSCPNQRSRGDGHYSEFAN